jgi:glycosyltransferase involved in cell wall biosynthesis
LKNIILISPFSLAQNPRLVKEYETLKSNGFNVKVFYGAKDKWASNFKHQNEEDFILVGGAFGSLTHSLTRIIHKLLNVFLPLEYCYNRISWLLYFRLVFHKADLYIGHNLASLPIVVKLAKFHKAKCGFDAEDFHRQEANDDQNSIEFKQNSSLEDKFLTKVNYFTAASPLIGATYKQLYPSLNPIVINNVFSSALIPETSDVTTNTTNGLKLFWFSQTIGRNRGLEWVISALGKLNLPLISLTLLGMVRKDDKEYFEGLITKENLDVATVKFLDPVKPDYIFEIASNHDVGLALEPGFCLNNKLALSNKLFTYITAGIGIIASETEAQKQFLMEYPLVGSSFKLGDVDNLAATISFYYHNREALLQAKSQSRFLAKNELNWENESKKFINIVKETLSC